MFLKKKKFDYNEQKNFALLSGDFNPIHLNKIKARKYFTGQIIVHGINIFLYLLEILVVKNLYFLANYKIKFKKYIRVDEYFHIYWDNEKKQIKAINKNNEILCEVRCLERDFFSNNFLVKQEHDILCKTPLNLVSDYEINDNTFSCIHSGKKTHAKFLYPNLTKLLGANIVFEIAGISAIIGMRYPGLRSIFLGLSISFLEKKGNKKKVELTNETRFGLVRLQYKGINIQSNLEACFRPQETKLKSYLDLKAKVNHNIDMQNTKVLIIGGSRGIGAITAKILSIYNCEVTITYYKCKEDAYLIKNEIERHGRSIKVFKLDITKKSSLKKVSNIYNQVYYFATPKILKNSSTHFDEKLYCLFHSFYVEGLKNILKKCYSKNLLYFMYPSTDFISTNQKGFKEYIKAKLEGEKVCENFDDLMVGLKINKPRIPQVLTDQTQSLIPKNYSDIIKIVNTKIIFNNKLKKMY